MNGRIVMVTTGSFGDVNPFVGLAVELKKRGHRPVIVTTSYWRKWIEDAGIECKTFETGWDIPINVPQIFLTKPAWESYVNLMDVVRSDDVLVSVSMVGLAPMMAAQLVAEVRGIPWVAVVLEPLSFFSAYEVLVLPPFAGQQPTPSIGPAFFGTPIWQWQHVFSIECKALLSMGAAVQALRPAIGLFPKPRHYLTDYIHADLVLALFSGVLAPRQPDWPRQTELAGFVFYDGGERQSWPHRLEQFLKSGPPPILFTLSSDVLVVPNAAFTRSCILAARAVGARAVIIDLTLPEGTDALVDNDVCFVRSASFAALFPRCAAIVHHGGVGTSGLALHAGKPMLVVPGDYAQPDIAARLQNLGVARVIPRSQFNGVTGAAALAMLLTLSTYAQASQRIAARLAGENGAQAACAAIEKVCLNGS